MYATFKARFEPLLSAYEAEPFEVFDAQLEAAFQAELQTGQVKPVRETCEARTRQGTLCKRRDQLRGGRCRLHGGLSTGPRTVAGKRRSAMNGLCPKRKSKAHE